MGEKAPTVTQEQYEEIERLINVIGGHISDRFGFQRMAETSRKRLETLTEKDQEEVARCKRNIEDAEKQAELSRTKMKEAQQNLLNFLTKKIGLTRRQAFALYGLSLNLLKQ